MRRDLGLLLLRLGVGAALVSHGYPKLFGGPDKQAPVLLTRLYGKNWPQSFQQGGPENFSRWLEQMGIPAPRFMAYSSGAAEFGGGLALAAGAMTPLAALLVLTNMSAAARKAHWEAGFSGQGGYELTSLFWLIALTLLVGGPGALSVDGLINRLMKACAKDESED